MIVDLKWFIFFITCIFNFFLRKRIFCRKELWEDVDNDGIKKITVQMNSHTNQYKHCYIIYNMKLKIFLLHKISNGSIFSNEK